MTRMYAPTRRSFLFGAGLATMGAVSARHAMAATGDNSVTQANLRGTIDAAQFGLQASIMDDQSRAFQAMLEVASDRGAPVHLPPGDYVVSNVVLPKNVRISGSPGATRIVYGGGGHFLAAENTNRLEIKDIVLDGANRTFSEGVRGLVDVRSVASLSLDHCEFAGSPASAIVAERSAGRIERCTISGAVDVAIYCIDSNGMTIAQNTIRDCGNGGILVHRWQNGADGTMIIGNRIERIGASSGGTGQNGNGINVFRASNVMVANNSVSDCAFSAIRANSSSDIQIAGNSCNRCGETAIYTEFAFEGAVVTGNIVDEAANGISIVNFDHGGRMAVCSNNLIRNLTESGPYKSDGIGFGIGISAEADTTISGNVIEGAPKFGILIGWGKYLRDVVASANVIRECGTGIAVSAVEGAGRALISGNVVSQSRHGAIVGYEWTKPSTGDLAETSFGHPANVAVERNHVS
jgi:uncharacterized secreted repeat protein (TIGR03808 family)